MSLSGLEPRITGRLTNRPYTYHGSMLLGHIAVGLAGRRLTPGVSLGAWILAVMLVDLIWPVFLLVGLEHVRIVPGVTAFTPLDFYDYPITHSLAGGIVWAVLVGTVWRVRGTAVGPAALLGLGVVSHWALDAIVHRPDLPVLPAGPFVGLGLWNSVAGTLAVELSLFAAGLALYLRGPTRPRLGFWLLIGFLVMAYAGAAFGPPPPDVTTLAVTALALWLLVPAAWWVDRPVSSASAPSSASERSEPPSRYASDRSEPAWRQERGMGPPPLDGGSGRPELSRRARGRQQGGPGGEAPR